jgi:hypothetical protein
MSPHRLLVRNKSGLLNSLSASICGSKNLREFSNFVTVPCECTAVKDSIEKLEYFLYF